MCQGRLLAKAKVRTQDSYGRSEIVQGFRDGSCDMLSDCWIRRVERRLLLHRIGDRHGRTDLLRELPNVADGVRAKAEDEAVCLPSERASRPPRPLPEHRLRRL